MSSVPETYLLEPNVCAPNSRLPILIYRSVLPSPISEESTTTFLTSHGWKKLGTWGHIPTRHFHPNVHECYGIFQGNSRLFLGRGQGDEEGGLEVAVSEGDVIVLPAGTAHSCLESSQEPRYRYIGVYPENGPKWRNEWGKTPIDHKAFESEIQGVARPEQDPVFGVEGPMMDLWK